MRTLLAGLLVVATSSVAFAGCPAKAPKKSWNLHTGDQNVGASFLEKNLVGKRLRFETGEGSGTEHYFQSGAYKYTYNKDNFEAASYRFYNDGVRCIDYPSPRFDRYVVNNGKIVLINWQGGRYEGKLMNMQ